MADVRSERPDEPSSRTSASPRELSGEVGGSTVKRLVAPAGSRPEPVEPGEPVELMVTGDSTPAAARPPVVQLPVSDQPTVISKPRSGGGPPLLRGHSPRDLRELLEGQQLGHLELEEFVGGGGMGAVFRATDLELGRTVAVKVVSSDHTEEETLRRFRTEAQSAARLDHENIARVHYVGVDKGYRYIVFEYIEGVNVRDLVEHKGPLPLEEVINYTVQIARALNHAAERDVVHRDIKPSNILIMRDGSVKVVDMGLARLHHVESSADDATASGVTLGTWDYISPEQARDPREADVRSDLYSLGCTIYFMLSGQPPFPTGTPLQKLFSHNSDQPAELSQFRDDIPDEFLALLRRLLAKQPEHRFQTPAELVAQLLWVAERHGIHLPQGQGSVVMASPREGIWPTLHAHLPWLVPGALLVAVVLFNGGEPPEEPQVPRPSLAPPLALRGAVASSAEQAGAAADPLEAIPAAAASVAGATNQEPPEPLAEPDPAAGAAEDAEPPATPAPEPLASVPEIHTLLVSGEEAAIEQAGVERVRTLSLALQRVAQMPHLETIEIRHQGEISLDPGIQVAVPAHLTLVATDGYQPVITFRPDLSAIGFERHMLALVGGNLTLSGLHFRVELPDEVAGDWALFQLRHVETVKLQRCSVTMVNSKQGVELQDQVAVFEFHGEPEGGVLMPDADVDPQVPQTRITLEETVVRGETQLVHAELPHSLDLQWQHGCFLSSRRLLELSGTVAPYEPEIKVHLEQVTVIAPEGICHLPLDDRFPQMPLTDLQFPQTVLLLSNDVALVEVTGARDVESAASQVRVRIDDARVSSPVRLRVTTRDGEMKTDSGLGAMDAIRWLNPDGQDLPPHARSWEAYRLQPDSEGNASGAGLEPQRLPKFAVPEARQPQPVEMERMKMPPEGP